MGDVQRRLAAIFSADAVGYSRLMALNEEATVRTVKAYRELIGAKVRAHNGRVVDAPGDNLLAEFSSVLEAVRCAVEVQSELAERNAELVSERRMPYRIGIHLGEVLAEDDRIYGDGVNVAARLEAGGEPGGVVLSGAAHGQVVGKLPLAFEDVGERELKNIPTPVRVYHIRTDRSAPADDREVPAATGISARSAIAVLPFNNLSGDPEQQYFADGIAEDLITRLSQYRWFPVIARNSSFSYKGRAIDVKQVSRELGVRYVIEGSVRKAGSRVRISAQLIDASTGHHVWADRYDRELRDIFALQDEIVGAIAGMIGPELRKGESERVLRKRPEDLDAWELVMRGMKSLSEVPHHARREDNVRAREFFGQAAERDPELAPAFCGIAYTIMYDLMNGWAQDPQESIADLRKAAARALEADDRDPFSHNAMAFALSFGGEAERAAEIFRHALDLDPSSALAHFGLGTTLAQLGRHEPACESFESALRLSPRDPVAPLWLYLLGSSRFALDDMPAVEAAIRRLLDQQPENARGFRLLAASLAEQDRLEEGRRVFAEAMRLQPEYTAAMGRSPVAPQTSPEFVERILAALGKVGLDE
jgi:adenylate cyclase